MMHDVSNSAINHKDVLSTGADAPRGCEKGAIGCGCARFLSPHRVSTAYVGGEA